MFGLEASFRGRRGQRRVAEFLLANGLRVGDDDGIYAGDVEIAHAAISRAVGCDRRIVGQTIQTILADARLKRIYTHLESIVLLRDIAKPLGFGAIEIIPEDAASKGIVADVSRVITEAGIAIRQLTTNDPVFAGAKMTVVTEQPIPRKLIDDLLALASVREVVVLC